MEVMLGKEAGRNRVKEAPETVDSKGIPFQTRKEKKKVLFISSAIPYIL